MKTIYQFLCLIFLLSMQATIAKAPTLDLGDILNDNQEPLLGVEQAFIPSLEIVDDEIIVKFDIAKDYYMYQMRFKMHSAEANLKPPIFPAGIEKDDPYFGLTDVYKNFVEFSVPYTSSQKQFKVTLDFQGCAEDRLCYPPTSREFELVGANISQSQATAQSVQTVTKQDPVEFVSEQQELLNNLSTKGIWWNFFKFISIGVLLAFTPCVFPMIPIISGIIAGQGDKISTGRAFALSLTYTQAVAIVYAILGILVALAGKSLSGYLQTPVFVISAAVVFILLSLSMFGFYELQLPAGLQAKLANKSNQQKSGGYLGTALMGAISALIVSPCVTAPLIAILIFISQSGDLLLGASALYGLGIGMGIPLIIIGVTGGKFLPKAGAWMDGIKAAFGVAMLGVALYLVKHLLPNYAYMYGWALLSLIPGYYLFKNQLVSKGWSKLLSALGICMMLYGTLLFIGGSQGSRDLLQPLKAGASNHLTTTNGLESQPHGLVFERVKTLAQLQEKVAQASAEGKSVMLDFFAVWCAACYEFEELVFTDPKVAQALNNTVLLQADVTDNDEQDVELMENFDVLGLPSIMFFNSDGQELPQFRATGFENAEIFVKRINSALN